MQIFIKTLTGRTETIDVTPEDTIEEVKLKLIEIQNLHPYMTETIRFVYAGKELDEGRKLDDYNVRKDSTLHQLGRLVYRPPKLLGCLYSEYLKMSPSPQLVPEERHDYLEITQEMDPSNCEFEFNFRLGSNYFNNTPETTLFTQASSRNVKYITESVGFYDVTGLGLNYVVSGKTEENYKMKVVDSNDNTVFEEEGKFGLLPNIALRNIKNLLKLGLNVKKKIKVNNLLPGSEYLVLFSMLQYYEIINEYDASESLNTIKFKFTTAGPTNEEDSSSGKKRERDDEDINDDNEPAMKKQRVEEKKGGKGDSFCSVM